MRNATARPHAIRLWGALRRLARPSSVVRALWLAVAALHAWLVLRRVVCGDWGSMLDAVRGALCLGGVFYGSLKFWRIATVFDAAPRRAVAFALVLLLGHWLLAAPAQSDAPGSRAPIAAVLIVAPALGASLALAMRTLRLLAARSLAVAASPLWIETRPLSLAVSRRDFFLFRRPPPLTC